MRLDNEEGGIEKVSVILKEYLPILNRMHVELKPIKVILMMPLMKMRNMLLQTRTQPFIVKKTEHDLTVCTRLFLCNVECINNETQFLTE